MLGSDRETTVYSPAHPRALSAILNFFLAFAGILFPRSRGKAYRGLDFVSPSQPQKIEKETRVRRHQKEGVIEV